MGPASVLALQVHPISKGFESPTHPHLYIINWYKDVDAAQMVTGDMYQLTRSKDGSGWTKPQNRPLKKKRVEGGSGCAVKCQYNKI